MSTAQAIDSAPAKLSAQETEAVRGWPDELMESPLEVGDEFMGNIQRAEQL